MTTEENKCTCRNRDKYHKCVDCGIEIYNGIADIIFTNNGQEVSRKQVWASGHVE